MSEKNKNRLLEQAIYPTLIRLSIPNIIALSMAVLVAMAELFYIGRLGTEALAAIALVFPFVMLTQMMSNGAMGSGVASAISRTLGQAETSQAAQLVFHALFIGAILGIIYSCIFILYGPYLYSALGGKGQALDYAIQYGHIIFMGSTLVWLCNTLASIIRGTGNMRLPSSVLFTVSWIQIAVGGGLGLGLGPLPHLGMRGVALGQVASMTVAVAFFLYYLFFQQKILPLSWRAISLQVMLFKRILSVGAVACISPVFSVLTALLMTRFIAPLGTAALAGYSIGQRLEFLIIPIAFGVGMAAVPMIGMAIGAKRVERARQVAKSAVLLGSGAMGTLGLVACLMPWLWSANFTKEADVLYYADLYLRIAAPTFMFLGIGLVLYFSSLGAGKVLGPVIAAVVRFFVVALGGSLMFLLQFQSAHALFLLAAIAMIIYGLFTVWIVRRTPW